MNIEVISIQLGLFVVGFENMQTQLKLEAPWEEVKEKIKEVNPDLTDEDLSYQPGNEQALLERLAKKMNRTTDDIKNWIESVSFNRGKAS
ncbi:MAG: hypothetical protein ABJA78_16085 [Ferruginibacter sp.]